MLNNIRSVRDYETLPEAVRRAMSLYVLGSFGNVAVIIAQPRGGGAPNRALDGRRARLGARMHVDGNNYVVIARNEPRLMHSEIICVRAFEQYLRRTCLVKFVFSEREPCHEGARNCYTAIDHLMENHGERGDRTPVRYLEAYPNRSEAQTIATHSRMRRVEAMKQARQNARSAILRLRRDNG